MRRERALLSSEVSVASRVMLLLSVAVPHSTGLWQLSPCTVPAERLNGLAQIAVSNHAKMPVNTFLWIYRCRHQVTVGEHQDQQPKDRDRNDDIPGFSGQVIHHDAGSV